MGVIEIVIIKALPGPALLPDGTGLAAGGFALFSGADAFSLRLTTPRFERIIGVKKAHCHQGAICGYSLADGPPLIRTGGEEWQATAGQQSPAMPLSDLG